MSAEVSVAAVGLGTLGTVAGAIGGAAVATVGAVAVVGVAAVATSLFAVGGTLATVGKLAIGIGKGVAEIGSIALEERRVYKEIKDSYRKLCQNNIGVVNKKEHISKIVSVFSDSTVITQERASQLINQSDVSKGLDDAYKLLAIQSTFTNIIDNFATLNDISEKLEIDCTYEISAYRYLLTNANTMSLDSLQKTTDDVNAVIMNKLIALRPQIEKAISERTYEAEFYQVKEVPEDLFEVVFNSEIAELLQNPPDDNEELKELVRQKLILDSRLRAYETVAVLKDMYGFEDKADSIIRLLGSIEKLSDDESVTEGDYEYEVDLKLMALDEVQNTLKKEEKYQRRYRFMQLLAEANRYRELLNLPPEHVDFDGTVKMLESMEKEYESVKSRYERNMWAKSMSAKMRIKYSKMNYRHISSADTVTTVGNNTLHKSYFVTPDKKNMLCITVNENGKLFERVVGVKVLGLPEDRKGVYDAQVKFCQDSKAALKEIKECGDYKINLDEPDMKYADTEDFSAIIPQSVLNSIRDARVHRSANEQRSRRVGE